jgi:DNA-binding transcriptional LysR family regulator
MNTLLNIKTFLAVARLGSFSAAARELKSVPSVITKRISQLEKETKTRLVNRSTRGLALTAAGERYLPRFLRLLAEHQEIFDNVDSGARAVEGFLRIQTPPVVTSAFLGKMFIEFQMLHPRLEIEAITTERSVNPLEEGFDAALGAWPISYPNVVDIPLCRYELIMVCAPSYLRGREPPRHPTDLLEHQCLTTALLRTTWGFTHARGSTIVEVHPRMHSSDSSLVRDAARMGMGIAVLPPYLVKDDLKSGALVPLLQEYPVTPHWMNVQVPRIRMSRPAVRQFVAFLKNGMQPIPPWEKE